MTTETDGPCVWKACPEPLHPDEFTCKIHTLATRLMLSGGYKAADAVALASGKSFALDVDATTLTEADEMRPAGVHPETHHVAVSFRLDLDWRAGDPQVEYDFAPDAVYDPQSGRQLR